MFPRVRLRQILPLQYLPLQSLPLVSWSVWFLMRKPIKQRSAWTEIQSRQAYPLITEIAVFQCKNDPSIVYVLTVILFVPQKCTWCIIGNNVYNHSVLTKNNNYMAVKWDHRRSIIENENKAVVPFYSQHLQWKYSPLMLGMKSLLTRFIRWRTVILSFFAIVVYKCSITKEINRPQYSRGQIPIERMAPEKVPFQHLNFRLGFGPRSYKRRVYALNKEAVLSVNYILGGNFDLK